MPLDASIYNALGVQPKSQADYADEYDRRDLRKLQLVGAQRQNELAALTGQQTQQGMARNSLVQAAQRQAAQDAGGDESVYARNLRLSGFPELIDPADKVDKAATERGTAKSTNAKRDIEAQDIAMAQYKDAARMVADKQGALMLTAQMHADPRLAGTPGARMPLEQLLATVEQMPFEQWQKVASLGATKYTELDKPTYQDQNVGGSLQTQMRPGMGGAPTIVGSTPITQSADNVATQETVRRGQNMSDARARDKNNIDRDAIGKVDWKQDTDGNWVALPKEVKSGEAVVPVKTTIPGKREVQAGNAIGIIQEARKLLDKGTGSYVGAGVDQAARAVGMATGGAVATAQLKALEGALMMAQPRMEGPQSNLDVSLYRQMAAQIGDPTVPAEMKKAALDSVESLHRKYAPNAPKSAPSATGPFTDAAKEQRYQEWKRKQGQ